MKTSCICVLAHNEEAQLERAILSLRRCSGPDQIPIRIYANGCTDGTVRVARAISKTVSRIDVTEIAIPSKVIAWNRAFDENRCDYLIFSDADIEAERGAIEKLLGALDDDADAVVASCRFRPKAGASADLESKVVGFLQQPLVFDYLCGGLYAVNRVGLDEIFRNLSLRGIPEGVTGEDEFLDMLLSRRQLVVIDSSFLYSPPGLDDFCKILARFDWQAIQLRTYYGAFAHPEKKRKYKLIKRALTKLSGGEISWWPGLPAVILRYLFMAVYARRIRRYRRGFGAVTPDGTAILTSRSRTLSGRS